MDHTKIYGEDTTATIDMHGGLTKPAPKPVKVTNNALHTAETTLQPGQDETNNVTVVEQGQFGFTAIKARTTTAVAFSATGAAGDFLHKVIVHVAPTTASLTISDGTTVILTIPTTAAIGTIYELNAVSSGAGWQVDLHASGAGSVSGIGRFS